MTVFKEGFFLLRTAPFRPFWGTLRRHGARGNFPPSEKADRGALGKSGFHLRRGGGGADSQHEALYKCRWLQVEQRQIRKTGRFINVVGCMLTKDEAALVSAVGMFSWVFFKYGLPRWGNPFCPLVGDPRDGMGDVVILSLLALPRGLPPIRIAKVVQVENNAVPQMGR